MPTYYTFDTLPHPYNGNFKMLQIYNCEFISNNHRYLVFWIAHFLLEVQ